MHRNGTRLLPVLVLALAGCSALPLPAEVDLRSRLGTEAQGSFEQPISEGAAEDVDARHPAGRGECVGFGDAGAFVNVESAQVHYNVLFTYDGPDLDGRLQARFHVAAPGADLWHSRNRLGPTVDIDLSRTSTRLAGTAVLSPAQLEAVNDRQVCWGVRVTGNDVSAAGTGTATFGYEIDQLLLRIRFSVL